MRDVAVLLSMLIFLPLAITSATSAYLLWAWTALISVQDYTYGFMRNIPLNQIFALIAMALIVTKHDPHKGQLEINRTTLVFTLFFLQATISVVFSYEGNPRTWELYGNIGKALLFCFFMPLVLTQRWRVHGLIVALVLGLAFHGLLEGIKTIISAGGHRIQGLAKFGDNNQLAVILVMALPLLIYLIQYSSNALVKLGAVGALILNLAAVVGTQSRGALLAIMALGLWIALGSRRKLISLLIVFCAIITVLMFAPETWWNRMQTIKEADSDSSFMTRVVAWKVSSAIALENPLTGGGFRAVQTQSVWDKFRESDGLLGFVNTPERPLRFYAAHSIFFEVLGDMGFFGLFLFLAILGNVFLTRWEIHKIVGTQRDDLAWIRDLSDMIGASLFAYIVGGAALSLAYFEVVYMLAMLMQVLKTIALTRTKNTNSSAIIST